MISIVNVDDCPLFETQELDRRLLVDGIQCIQGENGERYVSLSNLQQLIESYSFEVGLNSEQDQEKKMNSDRMLSKSEAAVYLGISVSTLDRRRLNGQIKAIKHGTNSRSRVVFDKEDLNQYLQSL